MVHDRSTLPVFDIPDAEHCTIDMEKQKLAWLGHEGKLWALEVLYNHEGEVCREWKKNLRNSEVMRLREDIFRVGFLVRVDEGLWEIIPPSQIKSVYLQRQTKYFRE